MSKKRKNKNGKYIILKIEHQGCVRIPNFNYVPTIVKNRNIFPEISSDIWDYLK